MELRTAWLLLWAATCACDRGSCDRRASTHPPGDGDGEAPAAAISPVKALAAMPHDRTAYTQGLAFWNGRLYEGTGLYGESAIRELDPTSGEELRRIALEGDYFGEGLTVLDDRLFQLTWREKRCFVYDANTLERLAELSYDGEGWGLTNDGRSLIMSDGSEWIRYRNPSTLAVERSFRVLHRGRPVRKLNELEFIRGEIWANVYQQDIILRIAPEDGRVLAVLDASKILPASLHSADPGDVLNGIAYDPASRRLLITGKRWPLMFEIRSPR